MQCFTLLQDGLGEDGKLIDARGLKFVIWLLIGDHEHFSNTLKLAHWNHPKFCWECDASLLLIITVVLVFFYCSCVTANIFTNP